MSENQNNSSNNKKRILFVDPDTHSYYLMADLLKGHYIDLIHVNNGPEAIQEFKNKPFIVCVVSEIVVPVIDGFGILKAIRKINPQIPAIAQTAYVHGNMLQKCREAGFNYVIFKPIDIKEFVLLIERITLQSNYI